MAGCHSNWTRGFKICLFHRRNVSENFRNDSTLDPFASLRAYNAKGTDDEEFGKARREKSSQVARGDFEEKRSLYSRVKEKEGGKSQRREVWGMKRFTIPKYPAVSVSSIDGKSSRFS